MDRVTTSSSSQKGFTLLEVLITLSILVGMVFAVSQMMKASLDLRFALSQNSLITHRLSVIMNSLSHDLSHAFLVSSKNSVRTGGKKRTLFRIEKPAGSSDILSMTYMGHQAIRENAKESDMSYVVYEVKDSKTNPSRKNLYRGEFPRVPDNFKEQPPMHLLVENVHSIKLEAWNGDGWSADKWDSSSGDSENRLPHMVRVTIKVWSQDPMEAGEKSTDSDDDFAQLGSIVYLPYALDFNEVKDRVSTYKL